jgi:hypothetical protein
MCIQRPHFTSMIGASAALTAGLAVGPVLALDHVAAAWIIWLPETGDAVEVATEI